MSPSVCRPAPNLKVYLSAKEPGWVAFLSFFFFPLVVLLNACEATLSQNKAVEM